MLVIFESLLPVFLLIVLGVILKRAPVVTRDFWPELERFGFYILFPALIFTYLAKADFSKIPLGAPTLALLSAILAQLLIMWLLRRPIKALLKLDDSSYSSFFQTSTRFNGFVLIAIVQNYYGQLGATLAVLVLATFMLPLNIFNVIVVVKLGARPEDQPDFMYFLKRIVTNPLIIACAAGLLVQLFHIPIYAPVLEGFDLVSRAALGMGLIMVGAGLRIRDVMVPNMAILAATFFKLMFFPALMALVCYCLGITGNEFAILVLGAAMPTAMNGYVLAKQYNGNAELYAAISVMQTIVCFFTISLIIYLVS